jgi:hypothetical protein
MSSPRGIALVLAILVTSFLTAIGLGLALIVMTDRLATGNLRGSVAMLYAADAALELAARDLSQLDDWSLALSGQSRSVFADGEPAGVRSIPGGGTVDLTEATNRLNCGRGASCSEAEMNANSRERPWGPNNPRWRLYAYGPLGNSGTPGNSVQFARPADCYLAVWVGDDALEQDSDPLSDAPDQEPGHGVLRLRAEAYGVAGARRALEAELARQCLPGPPEGSGCRAGIRVQSWQELRQAVP